MTQQQKKAIVLALAIQKGGAGKTTSAINIGAELAELGYKVLLIDADPQYNLTTGLGLGNPMPEVSLYDALMGKVDKLPIIKYSERLHVVPSNIHLSAAEMELVTVMMRETRLQKLLAPLLNEYDFILGDCPPSLGILTINMLSAADWVIIPVEAEYYALSGLDKLLDITEMIYNRVNPNLKLGGIIMTKYDSRKVLHRHVVDDVKSTVHAKDVFNTIIRDNVSLAEAPTQGLPIGQYAPKSNGAVDYKALTGELLIKVQQ